MKGYEPFRVAVGMVLQRNWHDGLESPCNAFDLRGVYLVVEAIQPNGYIAMRLRDHECLKISYCRNDITAEWFIPD